MKRSFLSFLTLLLASTSVFAQQPYHHHHHHYESSTSSFLEAIDAIEDVIDLTMGLIAIGSIDDYTGIRVGYNSASLRPSGFEYATTDPISGWDLGIVFGWDLGQSGFTIEPGLYYSMKGGRLKQSAEEIKFTMHTLELPAVMKYNIFLGKDTSLEPFAGAFLAIGMAGTTTYPDDEYNTISDEILDDLDAGLRFGVGLSAGHLYVEAAYDLGLVDLANHVTFYRSQDLRSGTLSFNFGINF